MLLLVGASAVAARAPARSQPRPKSYRIAIVLSTPPVTQINEPEAPVIMGRQIPLRRPVRIACRWEAGDHRLARQHIRRLVT